jgi:hypothetical protein
MNGRGGNTVSVAVSTNQVKGGTHVKRLLQFLSTALLAGLLFAGSAVPAAAAAPLGPPEISWEMAAPDMVRFQLHFSNPDPFEATLEVSGAMHSQAFGVFLPDYGTIGIFNVPPMAPESFFDVFFEVPLGDLPPSPPEGSGVRASRSTPAVCPPPIWVGNVDVFWNGPGGAGNVTYHFGDIGTCPGGAPSCVHVVTGCENNETWAINNVCAGWTVTLENQDGTPAPASLPPFWTGWICVTADANVPVGSQCCFSVDFWCNGVKATVNLCAYACPCETPTQQRTWGGIKNIYR